MDCICYLYFIFLITAIKAAWKLFVVKGLEALSEPDPKTTAISMPKGYKQLALGFQLILRKRQTSSIRTRCLYWHLPFACTYNHGVQATRQRILKIDKANMPVFIENLQSTPRIRNRHFVRLNVLNTSMFGIVRFHSL